jgi:hypothetical protein
MTGGASALLRFARDKRGYEHFYLVQQSTRRGRSRSRILYWFRTPPNVKVGRVPFDEEMRREIESRNPDVTFDWKRLLETPIPPPAADVERWRERRRAERAARQAATGAVARPTTGQTTEVRAERAAEVDPDLLHAEVSGELEPEPQAIPVGELEVVATAEAVADAPVGSEPEPESAVEPGAGAAPAEAGQGARRRRRRRGGRRRRRSPGEAPQSATTATGGLGSDDVEGANAASDDPDVDDGVE